MSYFAWLLPNVLAFPSMLPCPLLLPFLSSRLLSLHFNLRCPFFSFSVQSCLFLNSPALYSLFIPNYYNNLILTCSVGDIDHTSTGTGTGTGMRMGIGSGSTSTQGQGQAHEFDSRNALLASTFLLSSFPLAPRLIFIFKLYQRLSCFSFLSQI